MAFPGVITPRGHSRHRLMFERGYQADDETLMRRASIGDRFDVVRRQLSMIAIDSGPNAAVEAYRGQYGNPLSSYVQEQVAALQRPSLAAHASYRLNPQLYSSLVDQLALLPTLARYPEARAHRRDLVSRQGMYGIVGDVMKTELNTIPFNDRFAMRHRSGFIHETTPLALLVRTQDPNTFALPALPIEDEFYKVDLYHYSFIDGRPSRRFRQVKGDEFAADISRRDLPRLIGGRALGNFEDNPYWPNGEGFAKYQTARAIADEVSGAASDFQVETLNVIMDSLLSAVQERRPFVAQGCDIAA